jgi:hypothetical protein
MAKPMIGVSLCSFNLPTIGTAWCHQTERSVKKSLENDFTLDDVD